MAILRKKELQKMNSKDIDKRLGELRLELAKERAQIAIGATVVSPGRLREIRKTIARLETMKKAPREVRAGLKGGK